MNDLEQCSEHAPSRLRARSDDAMSGNRAIRIKDWDKIFSVSQSSRYKNPSWFPMPNKYDATGVLDLLLEDNGLEALGVWLLMTQLASKMPRKGVFVTDSGLSMSLKRIGQQLRISSEKMEICGELLFFVKWLEIIDLSNENTQKNDKTPSTLRADSEQTPRQLGAREEKKRKEKNTIAHFANERESDFELWWNSYDKKVGRPKSEKKWSTLSHEEKQKCISVVKIYVESTPDKKFRKDPLTYLNGRHWEDEILATQTAKTELPRPPKVNGMEVYGRYE